MAFSYVRPDWVRRLNAFGPATDGAELVPLDPDELLDCARAPLGRIAAHELGDDLWHEAYRRRVASIDRESQAHLLGRLLARAEVVRVLQTNLQLRHAWSETPAILDEPIERPIFVVGAPRTGTTILLELLALDPGLRAPISWESHHPVPHGAASDEASAMALAEAEQELWADIQPEMMTLHELRADLPCECVHFMALDFSAGYWGMQYDTPSYDEWAGGQPELVARSYGSHHRFLQTLQHGDRARSGGGPVRPWLLKTPNHLMTLVQLFAEYPDARIVHTHRDPLKFVASSASTIATVRWLRSDTVDVLAHGQAAKLGFGFALTNAIEQRRSGAVPDSQFVDSHYTDLMADPPAAMRRIYEALELPWPDGHDEVIRAYLRDKPKAKFGKHEYRFEDFGLDADDVRKHYAAYVEHYGVATEE